MTKQTPDSQGLSDAELATARPFSVAHPELAAKFDAEITRRGRPPLPETDRKRRTTIMLDADLLDRLKSDGKGWQTRVNAMLRDAVGL